MRWSWRPTCLRASLAAALAAPAGAAAERTCGVRDWPVAHAVIDVRWLASVQAAFPIPRYPVPRHAPHPGPEAMPVPESGATIAPSPPGFVTAPHILSPPPSPDFLALADNHATYPPDTHGAVGRDHLMVALNTEIRVQDRSGAPLQTLSLFSFWAGLGVAAAFDPRVAYDPYQDRWLLSSGADNGTASSAILIAASRTGDPSGTWDAYRIDADPADLLWADFPTLGFNRDWVAVQANMWPISGPGFETLIVAIDKAALYAGLAPGVTRFARSDIGDTQAPASTYDPALDVLYLVSNWNGNSAGRGYLRLFSISGAVGAETLTVGPLVSVDQTWDKLSPGQPNFAPQLGTSVPIHTDQGRTQCVTYRNGAIWAAQTAYLPAGGASRSAVQVWRMTAAGDVLAWGRIEDLAGNRFYAYPSLAVNARDDALVGFARFSASEHASGAYALLAAGDPPGLIRRDALLRAGEAPYVKLGAGGRNRWGDYSATAVDPANELDFWTLQEVAASPADDWATWWGRIVVSDCGGPPASPGATLRAVKRPAGVELSWSATAGAASYAVSRCDAGGGPCLAVGLDASTVAGYLDVGAAQRHLWYEVAAVNACGLAP